MIFMKRKTFAIAFVILAALLAVYLCMRRRRP